MIQLLLALIALACPTRAVPAQGAAPGDDYLVYVLSEAADRISLVRFGRDGLRVERSIETKLRPHQVNGPHGIAVSPDGATYLVSIAHGTPYGSLLKYATGRDSLLGRVELGMFPATVSMTPDGAFAFVANFNFQGDMVPSSVSVVSTADMIEVARTTTCTMPHGSRIDPQGSRHYSACMMDDALVEIDTRSFRIARHFLLGKGNEHGMRGPPRAGLPTAGAAHDAGDHGTAAPPAGGVSCSPTWAQPSADGAHVYVACNKANDVVEIDAARWTMTRRIAAGDGVYNLAVTSDGRLLLGTNKRGQSISIIDLARGEEVARVRTKRKMVHGVVVTPDNRYAFVTEEGLSTEPGTVEVIDLATLSAVAYADVAPQAAGIDFWKIIRHGQ